MDKLNTGYSSSEQSAIFKEEEKARLQNDRAEFRRKKLALSKKRKTEESRADREVKAKQLDDLLSNCAKFSDILTKKTVVLGRVGSGFDGKVLGEHNLEMAKQPKCMIGGTMRDYQLEGLTWMFEICLQGMSGILADEMGLGKTIQTISLLAKFREDANYMGPHLIIAPLSTLSNWQDEFKKWVPTIPVAFYHGTPAQRKEIFSKQLRKNLVKDRVNDKFPVVLTTPEIVIRDASDLSKINWEILIIDEGHRLKNSDSKLFRILRTFTSVTRFLITGTPLQNNLKELWSLLNFLLPNIFANWEQFESWFDFSDLQDEETTELFLQDQMKQDLVKKIHLILQPLLLRRIKTDVEYLLPRKREYLLYAPMTKEQTDLYNVINSKTIDTRKYLEGKVIQRLIDVANPTFVSHKASPEPGESKHLESEDLTLSKQATKNKERQSCSTTPKNAFEKMMAKKPCPSIATPDKKRKRQGSISKPDKNSVPLGQTLPSVASVGRRKMRKPNSYAEARSSDDDLLSNDEFEAKLAKELAKIDEKIDTEDTEDEIRRAKTLELAKREIGCKKLGNPIMQLRLTCNSPHNFYNPWAADSGLKVDETIVTSSGKMLLLDRLLPALFDRGSKVLIFSQFKTQLDILQDYAQELRQWNVCRIDGSISQEERQRQIKDFREDPEQKLFLLSTRAGGQGINLATADTVIIFDSDWNPQQDLQAQDRVHRIGQKNPVIIYRLATRGTVEEDLLLSADAKRRLEKLVIKKGGFKAIKHDKSESLPPDALRALLLKDGLVYQYKGGDQILSDADIETLCDRSEAAYHEAEHGLGDRETFRIVETKPGGLITGVKERGKIVT